MTRIQLLLTFLAASVTSIASAADFVTFESDLFGPKPDGFMSVDSADIAFSTTNFGDSLVVGDFGSGQSDGQSLAVVGFNGDNTGTLRMSFGERYHTLSLDFGNDDPSVTVDGDLAILDLYDGSDLVTSVQVVLNRDDLMNQSIGYSGTLGFDNAIFRYADKDGNNLNLIEVVDNINLADRARTVPGPEAALVFGLGAAARRRRRKA